MPTSETIRPATPTAQHTSSTTADLALLAMAAAWGSSYLAAKTVATNENSFGFLALRFVIATAALAVVLAPRLGGLRRDEVMFGTVFGCIMVMIFGLETFGVVHTSASNAGLIISLTIVITPVLSTAAGGDAPPRLFYGAAAMAVAGIGFLTQGNGLSLPTTGDLLILAAAVVRAVHVIAIDRACRTRPMDTGRLTLVQLATSLVGFSLLAQVSGSGLRATAATMSTHGWLLTIYLALVCTAFAFVVQMWAVRRTSATRVSLLLGTEPFFAAAIGMLFTTQPLTAPTVIGAVLVLAGTSWGRHIDNRTKPADSSGQTTVDATDSFAARKPR